MLMFDGASLDFMTPDVAAGRLPNVGRIFDQGAVLHLATLRPTQAEPVWSAIATGRYPIYNGIRSAAMYRAFGGYADPVAARLLLLAGAGYVRLFHRGSATGVKPAGAPNLDILSDRGARVGVIGWPLTQPAPRGWLRHQRCFHRLSEPELNLDVTPSVWPPELLAGARVGAANARQPQIRWRSCRRWAHRSR